MILPTVQFASTVSFTESVLKVDFASAGLNDTLTVGVPLTIDHFIAVTVDTGSWSASGSAITANFLFTIPTPNGATTDVGSITASQVNGSSASGTLAVTWPNQPVHFLFTDGTALDVTLGNLNVSCDPAANNCLAAQDPFYMSGTFLVLNGPTSGQDQIATPVPAALPLFATGLGALGLLGWRRKRKAKAAF